jgi:hypothetical protein
MQAQCVYLMPMDAVENEFVQSGLIDPTTINGLITTEDIHDVYTVSGDRMPSSERRLVCPPLLQLVASYEADFDSSSRTRPSFLRLSKIW